MASSSSSSTNTQQSLKKNNAQHEEMAGFSLLEEALRSRANHCPTSPASPQIIFNANNNKKNTEYQVRFSDDCTIVGRVPNRRDSSEAEINARWFGKAEYAELIWESSVTLTILKCEQKRHLVDDEILCGRGLIDRTSLKIRQEERSYINNLVLFQLRVNQGDQDSVAKLYHECSLPSVRRAREEALQDEEGIKLYKERETKDTNQMLHYTQQENRAAIEELILNFLQENDMVGREDDRNLKRALQRLTNRERQIKNRKKRRTMLVLQLRELAKIHQDPSLSPVEKATIEQAVEQLMREEFSDDDIENFKSSYHHEQQQQQQQQQQQKQQQQQQLLQLKEASRVRSSASLVAQADTNTLIEEVLLYKMREEEKEKSKANEQFASIFQENRHHNHHQDSHDAGVTTVEEFLLLQQLSQEQANKRQRIIY